MIFEQASRLKLRFETNKGLLSVEDLWDLSLTSLDNIYRVINKKLKEETEESLITTRSKSNKELDLKIEILKHVVKVKQEEAELKKARQERLNELELLRTLKNEKQIDALKGMSLEDLNKRIVELEEA